MIRIRIRIPLFTLTQIQIRLFPLFGIRILLLIKVTRFCDHWPLVTDILRLHFEPPRLRCELPRLFVALFWTSTDPEFLLRSVFVSGSLLLTLMRIRIRLFTSVADPDPGSDNFLTPGPGSGIQNRFFPDLGSRIPNPSFWELSDKFLGKKLYFSLKPGSNFFLQHFKNQIIYNFVKFVASVADPGSGAFLTHGSRIPNPYFWELSDNFLGKKFYNSLKIGPNFYFQHFKNK